MKNCKFNINRKEIYAVVERFFHIGIQMLFALTRGSCLTNEVARVSS